MPRGRSDDVRYDTTAALRHFENGEEIYPCRCGQTHRGDYAAHDWAHHNCFHDAPLSLMDPLSDGDVQAMCPMCGEVFDLERDEADAA